MRMYYIYLAKCDYNPVYAQYRACLLGGGSVFEAHYHAMIISTGKNLSIHGSLTTPPTSSRPAPYLRNGSGHLAYRAITQRCVNGYSAFIAVAVLQKE